MAENITEYSSSNPTSGSKLDVRHSDDSANRTIFWWHIATLVIAGIILIWFGRNQWFSRDEWDPIANRSVFGEGVHGLLAPRNEHWSTFGILIYRAHLALFGLRTYLPLMFVFVGVHLIAAHLLWRVMRRAGADAVIATALAAVFALVGTIGADMLYAWNVTFSGSLACGFGALLVIPSHSGWSRRYFSVWLLLLAALVFSGVGVVVMAVAVLFAGWSLGWRDGVRVASIPAFVYLVWLFLWGSEGVDRGIKSDAVKHIPETIWNSMTNVFDLITGWSGIGAVLVVLLLWFVIKDLRIPTRPKMLAVSCAAGAPLFFVSTSFRRYGALGFLGLPDDAWIQMPRYSYVAFALLLPLVALAITQNFSRSRSQVAVLLGIVGLVLIHQVVVLNKAEAETARFDQEIREHVVAVATLLRADAPRATNRPLAYCCAYLDVHTIKKLDQNGDLPDIVPSQHAIDAARTHLQVTVTAESDEPSGSPAVMSAVSEVAIKDIDGQCSEVLTGSVYPVIRLSTVGRSKIIIRSSVGGEIALWLVSAQDTATAVVPLTTFAPGGTALAATIPKDDPATLKIAASGNLLVRLPLNARIEFCHAVIG